MAMKPPSESPRRKQRRFTTGDNVFTDPHTKYKPGHNLLTMEISSLLAGKCYLKIC